MCSRNGMRTPTDPDLPPRAADRMNRRAYFPRARCGLRGHSYSQAAKLIRKGRKPQEGVPEPRSGMDPSTLSTWIFEREMWERIGRQYRSIGDAMAWRAFGFDRRREATELAAVGHRHRCRA